MKYIIATDKKVNYQPDILVLDTPLSPSGYKYGGNIDSGRSNWVEIPPLPMIVSDIVSETIDDKIYIMGGLLLNKTINSDIYIFHPVFRNYTLFSRMPVPVYRFAHVTVGKNIYFFGGYSTYENGENGIPTKHVQRLNVDTGLWATLV